MNPVQNASNPHGTNCPAPPRQRLGKQAGNAVKLARATTSTRDVFLRTGLVATEVRMRRALLDWTPAATTRVDRKARAGRSRRIGESGQCV